MPVGLVRIYRVLANRKGASTAEYGFLLAFVAGLAVTALTRMGAAVAQSFDTLIGML